MNGEKSVWTALFENWETTQKIATENSTYRNIETIPSGANCTVRVVFCFNKIRNNLAINDVTLSNSGGYGFNFDVRVINATTGEVVAYANSLYNNVEIMEFEGTGDIYTVQYSVPNSVNEGTLNGMSHKVSVAWIEYYDYDNLM